MITEDQTEVVAFLSSSEAHGLPVGASVDRIETHASVIFLAGDRAVKLKRAVRYAYLDYSTADRRKAMCEAEVDINRRTAPRLYSGVTPVSRGAGGRLALGGPGAPVDWVVEMTRFDESELFENLAAAGRLSVQAARELAAAVARFHQQAERRPDFGGRVGLTRTIEGNAASLLRDAGAVLDAEVCAAWGRAILDAIGREGARLDARRDEGFVRRCHGDLHLRNIVMHAGVPVPFDAIEFNDALSCIDTLYDLAFVLMDLWHRDLRLHANAVWNRYLGETGELGDVSLMPVFLSSRASIRALTTATAASLHPDGPQRSADAALARTYLDLAVTLLRPSPPVLVAIGGLSGTGKSTVAAGLAPALGGAPGAVVLRSDEIRKRILGVSPDTPLGADAYTGEMNRRVYAEMGAHAATVLRGGHSAVLDAVYADAGQRAAVEAVARNAGVGFVGLWLDAPPATLVERVESRRDDASDATAAVVRAQLARDPGMVAWHRIDASGGAGAVLDAAARLVTRDS